MSKETTGQPGESIGPATMGVGRPVNEPMTLYRRRSFRCQNGAHPWVVATEDGQYLAIYEATGDSSLAIIR